MPHLRPAATPVDAGTLAVARARADLLAAAAAVADARVDVRDPTTADVLVDLHVEAHRVLLALADALPGGERL